MKISFKDTIKTIRYLPFVCLILVMGLAGCGDDGPTLSTDTDISAFSLEDVASTFAVDLTAGTITNGKNKLTFGSDVSSLVATFSFSKNAVVTVDGVKQVSGTTPNDFSNPVTYTVTAEDEVTTTDFVVTVNIAATAWTKVATDPFVSLTRPSAFAYDAKLWLVGAVELDVVTASGMADADPGSYAEYVYSSTDGGVTWGAVYSSTPGANDSVPLGTSARTIGYNGKLVNVGGLGAATLGGFGLVRPTLGIAVSADDGASWEATAATEDGVPSGGNAHLLENNGALFIVGSQSFSFGSAQAIRSLNIYKSTNGTSWESIGTDVLDGIKTTSFPPTLYATATFKGEMYIAGGISGAAFLTKDIASYSRSAYKSADGVMWSVVSAEGFPRLAGTQIVEYKGKLYAIAGASPPADEASEIEYKRDVYVSEDGATWTLSSDLALPDAFDVRAFHNTVVLDDKIYIIGGENGDGSVRDVWVGAFEN